MSFLWSILFVAAASFNDVKAGDTAVVVPPTPTPVPVKDVRGKHEYFLRFGASQKHQQESRIVFGRVTPEGVHLWVGEDEPLFLKFSPIVDTSAAEEEKNRTLRDRRREESLGLSTPVLQFQFTGRELKECLNRREFQTFLKQMPLFQSVVSDFDIRSAGESGRACAWKVKVALETVGFTSKVTVGPLKEGGVTVRARIIGATDEYDESAGLNEEKDTKALGGGGDDLWIELAKGGKVPILVRPDGIFYKTFDPAKMPESLPMTMNYLGRYGQLSKAKLNEIPRLYEGENRINFEDVRIAQVYPSTIDEVTRIEIPRAVVQYLAEDQPPAEILTASAVAAYNTVKGNGIAAEGENFFTPADLEAAFRLNRRFFIDGTARLPVSVASDNFSLLHLDGDLNYLLIGVDPSVISPVRVYAGVGGYYFSGKLKKQTESTDESSFLQEFIGFYGRAGAQYSFRRWPITLEGSLKLSPLPETPVNSVSLSWISTAGGEYCWNSRECGLLRYQQEKFEIVFKTTGRSYREQSSYGLGYRRILF